MNKIRTQRRATAQRSFTQVRAIAHRILVHDPKGAHVSVWITPERRVEWWPGSGRWASGGPGTAADHQGDLSAFVGWIEGQRKAA